MRFDIHPFDTVQDARRWGCNAIDQAAGSARARYLTVGVGQDFAYQAKYADATRYVKDGYPVETVAAYPWVRVEADATGRSYNEVADAIKAAGDPWNTVTGPAIEGARLGAKNDLDHLNSIPTIVARARAAIAAIEVI